MTDKFTATPGMTLEALLQYVSAPATTEEIIDAARRAGGSDNAMETLRRLPARSWPSVDEAVAAATSGWKPTAG